LLVTPFSANSRLNDFSADSGFSKKLTAPPNSSEPSP
jgi:hypothetical protein